MNLKHKLWLFIAIVFTFVGGLLTGLYGKQLYYLALESVGLRANVGDLDLSNVQNTYKQLKAKFDGKLDEATLIEGASKGLVAAAGDDYTEYFSAKEADEFYDSLNGRIGGGVGIELGLKESSGRIYAVRVLKDHPAEKAGILAGDIILDVNSQDTNGWTVEKAVGQIRGEVGTTVKLTVMREDEIKNFEITRAEINIPSVDGGLTGKIGVLSVNRFNGTTVSSARQIVQQLVNQGAESFVLDLRGNPGGEVEAAIDLAGIWLNDKVIMIEKAGNAVRGINKTGDDALLSGVPTVVLVNASTASSSEIVTGALKYYKAATIVGEKTFGKGSVQQPIEINDGALLKVTVAKWYMPDNKNINQSGIEPDVKVEYQYDKANPDRDNQLDKAIEILGA